MDEYSDKRPPARSLASSRGDFLTLLLPASQLSSSFWYLVFGLVALTAFRLIALRFSVVELFFDESQYWAWSQAPAFGYLSKPPLLAWIILPAAELCGHTEACLRAPAPILYFATAIVTYFVARQFYDRRVAFWSSICVAFAPSVIFSSRIISTDVPLLFCWTVALLAFLQLVRNPSGTGSTGWAMVLGFALGFGMLAKYAMAYFFLGVILVVIFDLPTRDLMRRRSWWTAVVLALLIFMPNIIWNATHGFVTLSHTEDNIRGGGLRLSIINGLEFVGSQFGVFGPVVFSTFLLALLWRRIPLDRAEKIMVSFALPPLILVTVVAFTTKANANWAGPAGISVVIVAVAILVRYGQWWLLRATAALGLVLQIAMPIADANADKISLPFLRSPDIYARTMGWRSLAGLVERTAVEAGARSVAADSRDITASMIFYLRDSGLQVRAWKSADSPMNHFDFEQPLDLDTPEPILYVTTCPLTKHLMTQFASVESKGLLMATVGPHSKRYLNVFRLANVRGRLEPLPRCVE